MVDRQDEPPFPSSLAHLEFGEVHNRDELLSKGNHSLSGKEISYLIPNLVNIIKKNGTRRTLNQFWAHLLIRKACLEQSDQTRPESAPLDFEITPDQDPGLPPRLVQYGVGLALRTDCETTEEQPFKSIVDHLLEIKNYYQRQRGSRQPLDHPDSDPYYGMLWRELTTHRYADGYQMIEKGYRAYKPWEDEMEELLGFSIEDACYYTGKLVNEFPEIIDSNAQEIAQCSSSLVEFSDDVLGKVDEKVWISRPTLKEWCDDSSRFSGFLDRFSTSLGSAENFKTPSDINPLEASPFINIKDEYMSPLPRTLMYSLANTFYYDFIGTEYSGRFQLRFGDWLEQWTTECLSKIFPDSEIMRNYQYTHDGEKVEGDILICHEGTAIVIECKRKKLTADTRKGSFGGIGAIKQDIKRGIKKAYKQADRFVTDVSSNESKKIEPSNRPKTTIQSDSIDDFYHWIILGESYGSIATREFAKILNISPVPYICDIYDLQVIIEEMDNPNQLIHYIQRRKRQTEVQLRLPGNQYANSRTFSADEIDYLAVYLRNGGEFPPGAKRITGAGDILREKAIEKMLERGEFEFMF